MSDATHDNEAIAIKDAKMICFISQKNYLAIDLIGKINSFLPIKQISPLNLLFFEYSEATISLNCYL